MGFDIDMRKRKTQKVMFKIFTLTQFKITRNG